MMISLTKMMMIMTVMSGLEWAHHFWQASPSHLNTPFSLSAFSIVQCNPVQFDAVQCSLRKYNAVRCNLMKVESSAVQSFLSSGLQQPLALARPSSHKSVAADTSYSANHNHKN